MLLESMNIPFLLSFGCGQWAFFLTSKQKKKNKTKKKHGYIMMWNMIWYDMSWPWHCGMVHTCCHYQCMTGMSKVSCRVLHTCSSRKILWEFIFMLFTVIFENPAKLFTTFINSMCRFLKLLLKQIINENR